MITDNGKDSELAMFVLAYIFVATITYYVMVRLLKPHNDDVHGEELLYMASSVWPGLLIGLTIVALAKVIYVVSSILVFSPIDKLITYLIERKSSINKRSSDK